LRACREWAEKNGYSVAKAYIDQGMGAYLNLEERQGLKELLADALSKQRPFDVIIVYSLDRLFRDVLEFETFRARLEQEHVKLICVTDPWLAATVRKNPQVAISRPTGISVS
jgi:site-specific DNA recombinase